MTVEPYAYIGAAGLIGILLAGLIWAAPPCPRRTAVALITGNLIAWLVGEVFVILSWSEPSADVAVRATYAVIATLPLTFHRLVAVLDDDRTWRHRAMSTITFVFCVGTLASLSGNVLIAGAHGDVWGYHRISGPFFSLFAVLLFVLLGVDLGLLAYASRRTPDPLQRLRCQHMTTWLGINLAFGVMNLGILQPLGLHRYRMFVVPLGVTLSCIGIMYATARARLVDVPTALRRSLIHVTLLAGLLVPCLGLSLLAEQMFTGQVAVGPSFVTAGLFCVAGFVFPRVRVSAERTLEHALFGSRSDHRHLLEAASREVTTVLSLQTLAAVTTTTLARAFEEAEAILWMLQDERLVPVGRDLEEVGDSECQALLQWANTATEPLILSEASNRVPVFGRSFGVRFELLVALRVKDKTVGLLTLGRPLDGSVYTDDDIALVVTLANQVAIALENARLYEELRESREQVNRASRLSSVGMLAAGIAHEIRNPLVAVRTFLELFPQRKNDEEFCTTFQQLSLKEVDRITRLITELLTFARTHERTLAPVDVGEVVQHVAALLQPEAGKRTVNLMLSCGRDVPAVEGDASQLQQVILNLVLNAIEASPAGGTVTILVQSGRTLRGEPHVRIEVADEGPGVLREHREAIFTPFFTTKDTGTGLGLAVAHQLVVEHGGTLSVTSPPSGGSTFAVTLPTAAAASRATSERQLRVVNG